MTLVGAASDAEYPITLVALETPTRPAIPWVSPTEYATSAYRGQQASVRLSVGEAGGQMPLEDVTAILSSVTGPDGVSKLPPTTPTEIDFGALAAGRSTEITFALSIPADAPPGDYVGEIQVASPGTDGATAMVTVTVLQRGDMNCDGLVNNGDIDAFVLALTNSAAYTLQYPGCNIMNADINGDGLVNNGDIDAFVALLTGGG
jgi:hypothetical protein